MRFMGSEKGEKVTQKGEKVTLKRRKSYTD